MKNSHKHHWERMDKEQEERAEQLYGKGRGLEWFECRCKAIRGRLSELFKKKSDWNYAYTLLILILATLVPGVMIAVIIKLIYERIFLSIYLRRLPKDFISPKRHGLEGEAGDISEDKKGYT